MTRLRLARSVLRFLGAQIWHAIKIATALIRPSHELALARSFGDYLSSVTGPFDQSSSNRAINRKHLGTSTNALLDNLCRKAAEIYAAPFARISLGGSSKSIRQIVGHVIPRATAGKSIILLDPACHKSVFGGLIESGLDVIYLRREYSETYGVFGPIDVRHLRACMSKLEPHLAAVFITYPTYEGFAADLSPISSACRSANVLLCIDGAWGSNFSLVDGLPCFPMAIADIVITSPHKKGAAPSQVGLVLFRKNVLVQLYDEASQAGCETTSPNWLLLMLFEHRLAEIASGQWNEAWQKAIHEAAKFRRLITEICPQFDCPPPQQLGYLAHDPTHVFVCTSGLQISGADLADILSEEFQIDAEMSGPNGLLFLFGPAHAGCSAELVRAIKSALQRIPPSDVCLAWTPPRRQYWSLLARFHPRLAYFSPAQTLPLEQCEGRISASLVYAYPPGIPLLAYGETITPAHIDAIKALSKLGTGLTGVPRDLKIRVTRAPPQMALRQPRTLQRT